MGSIIPYRIPLPSEFQRQHFFHFKCFCPGLQRWNMIVETWPEVPAVLLHNIGREFVALFISIAGAVLFKSFLWRFTGHAYI